MIQEAISPTVREGNVRRDTRFQLLLLLILSCGVILKIVYAQRVPYNISPHDLGEPNEWIITDYGNYRQRYGHINYIQHIYYNHQLPRTYWGQFYHPPLFHLFGACVVRFFHHFGCDHDKCLEILQLLNMCTASVSPIIITLNMKKIRISAVPLLTGAAIVSFHPVFYNMGAALNNDALATTLGIAAVYFTTLWFFETKTYQIILIALCIGLGMFTKLSVALVAPAIGGIFLFKLITIYRKPNESEIKINSLIVQLLIFAVICIPIGLAWSVHNAREYGISISYVPRLSEDDEQYIGNVPVMNRILLPTKEQLFTVNMDHIEKKPGCYEKFANIWGHTFFTAAFDESMIRNETGFARILSLCFLWSGIILGILMNIFAVYSMVIGDRLKVLKYFYMAVYLIIMGFYVKFCFDYPFMCTMNFRYIPIGFGMLAVLFACGCGNKAEKKEGRKPLSLLKKLSYTITAVWSILSSVLYFFYY